MIRLITIILLLFSQHLVSIAQEEPMRVERTSAVNPDAPVYNVHVDKEGEKWVSNSEGLWQVHAADLATPVVVGSAEESLLNLPGGNADIRWLKGAINDELGGIISGTNVISAAYYNEVQDHLWIGTSETGIFLFRTQPNLKWIKEINKRMPKLRSEKINMIYVDGEDDRHFIGTDQGVIAGRDGRWGLEERYFRFQAVANRGKEIWLLAEDLIWVISPEDRWRTVEIDPEKVSGPIKDIAFDRDGKLWIASEYLTMFDVDNNKYKVFDGGDYFTSSDVNCIAVDPEGAVWVGTQDKGLYVIEKESAMTVTCLVEKELSCDPNVNDASLVVKINGGQPPYTYQWDQGLTGENPQNLAVGTYLVTVTDSRGQAKVAEGVVPDTRLKLTATQNRAHSEEKRGAAKATVEGGKPKYIFVWDNGEVGPQAERLEAGTHSVTVTDVNGCKAETTVEISRDAAVLAANIVRIGDDHCAENDVHSIQVNISGGISPYEITWSDPSISGEKGEGIKPGTYFATVTDAQNNSVQASINLQEIEVMKASASQLQAADLDGNDGSGLVEVTGTEGRLKYQWDNGESKARAQKLTAGSHTVTVTDQNGCTATATVEITREIAELALSLAQTSKSKCAGDGGNSLQAMVKGGSGPYSYQWSDSELSGTEATGVKAGVYHLTVTDSRGEAITASVNVEKVEPLTVEASVHSAATANNNDGRASVRASGGTGNYTYAWSNGESNREANSLAPGTHQVMVTDEAGCEASATVEIDENISAMSVVLNLTRELKCNGANDAALEVVVKGGKSPFSFTWSDAHIAGEKAEGLGSGQYAVTVSDAAGNAVNASIDVVEPEPLVAEVVEQRGVTDEASKDGKAEVRVSGGAGGYQFQWDNQFTGQKVENLSLGAHEVTVTDGNGCEEVVAFETKQKILPQLSLNRLRSGQVVQMQMLQFDADSVKINETAEPILDEVYEFLKDNPGIVIRIEGHTNNVPPDEFCDRLSTARAKSVAEYIVQQGIAGERVYYRGYGKRQPLYSNLTPEGRRLNQRVEIKILNIGEDDSG